MEVVTLSTSSPLGNWNHLIVGENQKAIAIDPFSASQIQSFLGDNGLELDAILLTHNHRDHTAGLVELYQQSSGKPRFFVHPRLSGEFPIPREPFGFGTLFPWDTGFLCIRESLGHTLDHITLWGVRVPYHDPAVDLCPNPALDPQRDVDRVAWDFVVTGDTVFPAGVGHCRLGGDVSALFDTIQEQFLAAPDHTRLYPGHNYWESNLEFSLSIEPNNRAARDALDSYRNILDATSPSQIQVATIGLEKKINPFFRCGLPEFQSVLCGGDDPLSSREIFKTLRRLRDEW